MSNSKRHHYVPQVHLKKFKGLDGYFLFFKKTRKIETTRSTVDFFVKKELNTTGTENGEKDHRTFENELGKKWDSQFNTHYFKIIKNRFTPEEITQESLRFFFEYSIITRMRRAKMEKEFNDEFLSFKSVLPEMMELLKSPDFKPDGVSEDIRQYAINMYEQFSSELDKLETRQKGLKYPALIPSEAKMLVPNKCYFHIFNTHEDSFILPDSGAMIENSNEKFEFNSTKLNKISFVIIPLNPTLSLKIINGDLHKEVENRSLWSSKKTIELFNSNSIRYSFDQVLSSNRALLEKYEKCS